MNHEERVEEQRKRVTEAWFAKAGAKKSVRRLCSEFSVEERFRELDAQCQSRLILRLKVSGAVSTLQAVEIAKVWFQNQPDVFEDFIRKLGPCIRRIKRPLFNVIDAAIM